MTRDEFQHEFFLSYERSTSREFAESLKKELETNYGARVFLDLNLQSGDKWAAEITDALKTSRVFVAIIPGSRIDSPYFATEVLSAIELAGGDARRRVTWVYTGDGEFKQNELPFGLPPFQGVLLTNHPGPAGVAKQLADEHMTLGGSSSAAPSLTGVKLYSSRNQATAEMQDDVAKATHAYFMGVSHRKLASILQEAAERAVGGALPLERVEVYFANEELGTLLDRRFAENMRAAILSLGTVLKTHPRFADPQLEIYQFPHVLAPNGSRFRLASETPPEGFPFSVVYDVVVERGFDLSVAWTMCMRLLECDPGGRDIFQRAVSSYERLEKTRRRIFTATAGNLWDRSGPAWSQFQSDHLVYEMISRALWEFGAIGADHDILDLGSGTGTSLVPLARELDAGSLTLVDTSPGMLVIARDTFAAERGVNIVLGDACRRLPGDYADRRFDRITSCLSLQSFSDDIESIAGFARNCASHLKKDGRIIIGVHNSFMRGEPPEGFANWTDPLREAIKAELSERKIPIRSPKETRRKFDSQEIIGAFGRAGLHCERVEQQQFVRSIEDRVAMWRAPAVFNSIADMRRIDSQTHADIVSVAGRAVRHESTMPTTVTMFRFCA